MRRLLVIIAALFSFSAVAGPTVAAAMTSAPAAVAEAAVNAGVADYCVEEGAATPKAVSKICPKKNKGGLAVFCHQCMAVMPVAAAVHSPQDATRAVVIAPEPLGRMGPGERQFRPPRGPRSA